MQEIRELEESSLTIYDKVREKFLKIEDNETFEKANRALIYIKNMRGKIDEVFRPIIQKAHQAHKEVLEQRAKVDKPFVEAENYLKPMLAGYLRELERKKREAEARKVFAEETPESREIIERPEPEKKNISIIPVYKFRIVDKKIVPAKYWVIDEQAIGRDIREAKGKITIPGVEIYTEDSLRARKQ